LLVDQAIANTIERCPATLVVEWW